VPLEIEGGDGEKTLGEAEKTFICWRKRFIIIPGMSLSPLSHHRFMRNFTSYIIYGKSLHHPLNYGVVSTLPPNYETV